MIASFRRWGLSTPTENVEEIYIDHNGSDKAFAIRVLDDTKVEITTYSNSAKIYKQQIGNKTIYIGETGDVDYPHIIPNR